MLELNTKNFSKTKLFKGNFHNKTKDPKEDLTLIKEKNKVSLRKSKLEDLLMKRRLKDYNLLIPTENSGSGNESKDDCSDLEFKLTRSDFNEEFLNNYFVSVNYC